MRLKFFTIVFVVIFVMAGCRSDDGRNREEGNVLCGALQSEVRGLDPADITDVTSTLVASQVFESLYQYHYLKRPYELVCQLAESMPQFSEDGLSCTIRIKKGVYFAPDRCFKDAGGRELKAADFVYSWKRIADIRNLSRNWRIFEDRIVGLDEFREYTKGCRSGGEVDYGRDVEGLHAADDYTLLIRLKRPWPQITYYMAGIATAPVAKEAVEYYGGRLRDNPVGTGPFKLRKWQRGSYIELVRNEKFRGELYPDEGEETDAKAGYLLDAGRRLPFADRILFVVVGDEQSRWFLFMQGKIDVISVPKDNYSEAINEDGQLKDELEGRGIELKGFEDPSTFWLGFNMADKLLGGNKQLRRAISSAIDREKYQRIFYNNRGEVAYGIFPPMLKCYNRQIRRDSENFAPQEARRLVKEAEAIYGGTIPKMRIAMPGTSTVFRQQGDFFRRSLEDVGLSVDVEYMDWPRFQEKLRKGDVQIFSGGWIGQYPDGENFLQLFYSRNIESGLNGFNYRNARFDSIYEQAVIMKDGPERDELYRRAEEELLEDVPAVFLRHGYAMVLQHGWLKNYKPHAFGYGLSKYRRIEGGEKGAGCGREAGKR